MLTEQYSSDARLWEFRHLRRLEEGIGEDEERAYRVLGNQSASRFLQLLLVTSESKGYRE